jgi:hypothetical protein
MTTIDRILGNYEISQDNEQFISEYVRQLSDERSERFNKTLDDLIGRDIVLEGVKFYPSEALDE